MLTLANSDNPSQTPLSHLQGRNILTKTDVVDRVEGLEGKYFRHAFRNSMIEGKYFRNAFRNRLKCHWLQSIILSLSLIAVNFIDYHFHLLQ